MISYAQNFEDVILARAFAGKTDGFYVDIGAMDPELHSVTKYFYDLGWRGLNVEPGVEFHRALQRRRSRDVNLCVAVGAEPGERAFYDSERHGISTFRPDLAAHFSRMKYHFTTRSVEVVPLREICHRHCPTTIDFMKVDVEGSEKEVLASGDWDIFRPRIVLVEAVTPDTFAPSWAAWEYLLLEKDYAFTYFDGLNRFYVRKEDESLRPHFELPPNVLDRFETHEVVRLRKNQFPCRRTPPVHPRRSLWVLTEREEETEWQRVTDISFLPRILLTLAKRCLSAVRTSSTVTRRFLRRGGAKERNR